MKVLITGGAGFIGRHLAARYQGRAAVRVLDNLRSGREENLAGMEVDFRKGDVRDASAVAAAMAGVDVVYHLAAMVSVPESLRFPRECVDINVNGTLTVLEAAAMAGVGKLVLASSAAVYGDSAEEQKRESHRPEPKSPYAVTKLDGEYYCEMFASEGRLHTAALRFFNVFGPGQDPDSPYAAALPAFFRQALTGRPLTVFGDGEQTRDFIAVRDIVSALAFAGETGPVSGVYNCGYGQRTSLKELIGKILALTGSASRMEFGPERPGDVRHSQASVEKLFAAGWRPESSLDEGLREALDDYREKSDLVAG